MFTALLTQHSEQRVSEGERSLGEPTIRDERERTGRWNRVGWFLLKSRSFELILW